MDYSRQYQLSLHAENICYLMAVAWEGLWDREYRVSWNEEPDVEACGRVSICMSDKMWSVLLVIAYQEHKDGHCKPVLSEKRPVQGTVEVDIEEDMGACVAALREERGIDLRVVCGCGM